MKISRCIAAALLVASTTTGCSSCAKDDAPPASQDTPAPALTNRQAAPLPRGFERKAPPGVENVNVKRDVPTPAASAVVDAGSESDATTH